MAGLYIHIPFCRQACHYCNFHFSTVLKQKNDFIRALLKETELQKDYLGAEPVTTIYFGGGTPSILEPEEISLLLENLYASFHVEPDAEITLEANPDDMQSDRLAKWKRSGINRLSLGVQSFTDEDLQWMHRAHNAEQALAAIRGAQDIGFRNISIDLIYGSPNLTDDQWMMNVETAVGLEIPHLSCYALTVEPRTALHSMISRKKLPDIDPDRQAGQFLLLMDWMERAGYEHYEISNFARPGSRSRHNGSYWQGSRYLGLGPAAHSFDGVSRQWNVANNSLYIQAIARGEQPCEKETLTTVQKLNEWIMTGLRTLEGISLQATAERFGAGALDRILANAQVYLKSGRAEIARGALRLTREGKLLADGIAAHLFFDEAESRLLHAVDSSLA